MAITITCMCKYRENITNIYESFIKKFNSIFIHQQQGDVEDQSQEEESLSNPVNMMLDRLLVHHLGDETLFDPDHWRSNRLYFELVNNTEEDSSCFFFFIPADSHQVPLGICYFHGSDQHEIKKI